MYRRRHAKAYLRHPPPTAPGKFQVFLWHDGFESFKTIYVLWSSLGIYILNLKEIAPQGAALLSEKLLGLGATFQTTMSAMLDSLKDLPRDGRWQPYVLFVFHKIQIGSKNGVQPFLIKTYICNNIYCSKIAKNKHINIIQDTLKYSTIHKYSTLCAR